MPLYAPLLAWAVLARVDATVEEVLFRWDAGTNDGVLGEIVWASGERKSAARGRKPTHGGGGWHHLEPHIQGESVNYRHLYCHRMIERECLSCSEPSVRKEHDEVLLSEPTLIIP